MAGKITSRFAFERGQEETEGRACLVPYVDRTSIGKIVGRDKLVPPLWSAAEKQSIDQQQDHCAYHRHEPTGIIICTHERPADPGTDECTGDTQKHRNDTAAGVFARYQ